MGEQSGPAPRVSPARRQVALVLAPAAGITTLGVVAGTAPAALPSTVVPVLLAVAVVVLAVVLHGALRSRDSARQMVSDLAAALEESRDGGVVDDASGLLNRHGVLLVGRHLLESARRSGGALHCCVVEVAPGGGGDRLAGVAAALRAATRAADVVGCDGEGRFLVVGPGTGLHAQELERRVRAGLAAGRGEAPGGVASAPGSDAVDVGAAVLAPWDDGEVPELLGRAERALAQRRALRASATGTAWGRRRVDRGPL
ncbi:hypothetical protein [Kineococcus sp. NUM-3379]